jgi:GR25 family glycosyltransferase involved in LPS biosynthesis
MNNIEHIYIAHCAKLTARGEYIKSILEHPFFLGRTTVNAATEKDDDVRLANSTYQVGVYPQALKRQEICFVEQMFTIFQDIVDKGYSRCLILEDDFRLAEGFDQNYERVFSQIPEDASCTFLGTCCGLLAPSDYLSEFFPTQSSRCGIAYTITREFCEKFLAAKQYFLPLDWHLTHVRNKHNSKFYWSKTILFIQGSEGVYPSNIR